MTARNKRDRFLVLGCLTILVALAIGLQLPEPAWAWGSLRDGILDYNTHGNIDVVAWRALNAEIDLTTFGRFPDEMAVFNNDFVAIGWTGNQLTTSTGPDYEPNGGTGPITSFAWHYGDGPSAAQQFYNTLIAQIKANRGNRGRSAAWLAHFVGDQYVPYHRLGVRYTGQAPSVLDDPAYNDDPVAFATAAAAATNGNVNWYDGSYWDGFPMINNSSTHILWERGVVHPTTAAPGFDALWNNTLAISTRMNNFVQSVGARTTANTPALLANRQNAVEEAVRGVYTAWRGAISALNLRVNVAPGGSDSFKVVATVRNLDRLHGASDVQAKITVPAGYALVSGLDTLTVGSGSLAAGAIAPPVEWEVQSTTSQSAPQQLCPEIKVSVTGNYPVGEPDLAGPAPNWGVVEEKTAPAPIVRITSPATGAEINDTKVDVSGEIDDPQTKSWIVVNGSDKFWISQGYDTGTSFTKKVELKGGDNTISVYAVNKCGKMNSSTIHVKGNFTEPAIKVVMSWNTNGTDVDLHLTDSNGGSECYYNNMTPNWGDPNSNLDDPKLDIDNRWGYGPETIILPQPKPGSYTVRIVYYSDHNEDQAIPSLVTVKVYEYGQIKGSFYNTLPDTGATWEGVYVFRVTGAQMSHAQAAPAAPFVIQETRITDEAAEQSEPAISGSQIIWQDGRHSNHRQLYQYDLATHTESRVSSVPLNNPIVDPPLSSIILQKGADIAGDQVLWKDNRYDTVAIYQATSPGADTRVFTLTTTANSPLALSNNRLVWEDTRNTTEESANADIYMYNLSTNAVTRITTEAHDQLAPDISGNFIVWTDTRLEGGYTIFMYDLASQTETQIARASSGGFNPPAIDGNYVVWADDRNGNSDIFAYNISGQEEMQITSNASEQNSPAISGNKIVWVDYRNGNADIYMYDLTTHTEIPICTNPAEQQQPAINGSQIVWTDYRNGNADIYLAQIGTQGKLYLPVVTRIRSTAPPTPTPTQTPPPDQGINGQVTFYGAASPGIKLELRYYNGSGWSTLANGYTNQAGVYNFTGLPSLQADQKYYLRYVNTATSPNPGAGYLYSWYTAPLTSYSAGTSAAGGNFDVGDIPLVSPDDGASLNLPATFCWTPRNIPGDTYWVVFYNPVLQKTASTDYLGAVSCVNITSLPSTWSSGTALSWYVGVAQESNKDNYGYCYGERQVTLYWSASQDSPEKMQWRVVPADNTTKK